VRRVFRGKLLSIDVKNPDGVSRGVSCLQVNGRQVSGNLVSVSDLEDGMSIVAVLG
jgi:hypothetical protein